MRRQDHNDQLLSLASLPDSGRVSADGLDVATHALDTKRRLAYIPEQTNAPVTIASAHALGPGGAK